MQTDEPLAMVTHAEMRAAITSTAFEFIELVRSMPPQAVANPVPGLAWTAGDVVAHVIGLMAPGREWRTRGELEAVNAHDITEVEERDPLRLAELLTEAVTASAGRKLSDTEVRERFGVERLTGLSYFLCDLLLHGRDIAAATGQPWTIQSDRAAVGLRVLLPGMLMWVRPEVVTGPQERVVFGFGDDGPPVLIEVGDGAYSAGPGSPADVARSDIDAASVLIAMVRHDATGDQLVDRFATWFLPI